jgi:hypothetical protein
MPNFNSSSREEDPEGVIYVGRPFDFQESSEFSLGNIFFGVNNRGDSSKVWIEAGFRLPAATLFEEGKGAATAVGLFSDYINRMEAFAPEYASLIAVLHRHQVNQKKFSFHFNGGISILLPTRDETISPEWYLLYGFQLVKEDERGALYAGIDGRIIMSREPDYFRDQTTHQLSLRAVIHRGAVSPGLYFNRPLDNNLTEVVNWTAGISVQYQLRGVTIGR